jgi:superkiller protein 3
MPTREEMFASGLRAYGQGKLEEAVAAFNKALQLDPEYADAHFGMAMTCSKLGRLDDAILAIRKAIELNPDEPLYHTELSRLYVQLNMIPEAEAERAEAMRLQQGR